MVLAAGLGTRLRPFTERTPKPLIPLYGIPCIEFVLLSLQKAGVREAVVNIHAHADQVRAHLHSSARGSLQIAISDESRLLLGSAGGIRHALPLLGKEAFFSMNADVLHLAPLEDLARRHQALRDQHNVLMTLVLASGEALAGQDGEYREIVANDSTGLIEGFAEKKRGVPFFTGTAVFEPDAFRHLPLGVPAEFVPEVLQPAIRAGRVGFLRSDAVWLDIGSPELWFRAEQRIREILSSGRIPDFLANRLKHSDPSFGGRFELGKKRIRLDDTVHEIEDFRDS
ncbi:MAG: nucleotidyltransferase family protein [Bdellovibrionales bacterium]|nr:nucleotidyltransferase family protein [Bdellovibrionales bacterium]